MSGGIFICRADAPYGSHPSGRAVQPRPLRGISDGQSIACLSRFGRIGRTWENEGDGTTTHCRCRELSVSTLLTLSVWAGMPIRTTDQSALTDGLRLAGSGQRFRPREAKSPMAISESADEPQTLQGTEVSPMVALFFAFYPRKDQFPRKPCR